jgi:hypothetical protein
MKVKDLKVFLEGINEELPVSFAKWSKDSDDDLRCSQVDEAEVMTVTDRDDKEVEVLVLLNEISLGELAG